MIGKGTTHNNGTKLAVYMTTAKKGERAELWQLRGFEATNIKDAFRDVHIMAEATKCQQPFFHLQLRNREGETLTREQWEVAANRIERMLGLTGQPRAIAFHTYEHNTDEHMHVAWSRIDEETLTAKPLPFFKFRLKNICRELELHFGMEPVVNQREGEIKYAPKRDEHEQARRLGLDIHEIRNTIRDCYDRSDCGASFRAALEHEGLTLAQGERRDFVVIDQAGGVHAIGKRILDVTAAKIRERLSDLPRHELPTVEQAREAMLGRELADVQKAIQAELQKAPVWDRDQANQAWENAVTNAAIEKEKIERRFVEPHKRTLARQELTGPARDIREASERSDNAQAFVAALAERGIALARATKGDALQSQLDSAEASIRGSWKPRVHEGEIVAVTGQGQLYRLTPRSTGKDSREHAEFLGGFQTPLPSIADAQQQQHQQRRELERELEALKAQTEPELNQTAGNIRLAYNLTDGPEAFRERLQQDGLTVARVTAQDMQERDSARQQENRSAAIRAWDKAKPKILDAEQSLPTAPEPGKHFGRLSDHAREGDVVILDKRGNIYELNQRTTGDTRRDAQAFVAGIGPLSPVGWVHRELEEKRQRPIHVPTGPHNGGLVAHQMWALRRLQDAAQQRQDQQRHDQQRREEERRRAADATNTTGKIDPQRYLTDPDYRRQVRLDQASKTPQERKVDRENELRALLEQQDRQR